MAARYWMKQAMKPEMLPIVGVTAGACVLSGYIVAKKMFTDSQVVVSKSARKAGVQAISAEESKIAAMNNSIWSGFKHQSVRIFDKQPNPIMMVKHTSKVRGLEELA